MNMKRLSVALLLVVVLVATILSIVVMSPATQVPTASPTPYYGTPLAPILPLAEAHPSAPDTATPFLVTAQASTPDPNE